MKGTEKQIKWAEDIKSQTIRNIEARISANESIGMFEDETKLYKIMAKATENMFSLIDDASIIINKRNLFDIRTIDANIQQARTLIRQGKLTVEQFAKINKVEL